MRKNSLKYTIYTGNYNAVVVMAVTLKHKNGMFWMKSTSELKMS